MGLESYGGKLVRRSLVSAGILWVLALPVSAGVYQDVAGIHFEAEVDRAGESPLPVKFWVAPGRMRMDSGEQTSMISIGEPDGKMIMIMHRERRYIEFTHEMMERFAGMMGQMQRGGPPEAVQEPAGSPPRFVPTGNTKTVGPWNASEVRVEVERQAGEVMVWFSEDVGVDLRRLLADLAAGFASLQNPLTARMGGGGQNAVGMFMSMQRHLEAMDLPDGFPVQMIATNDDGSVTTVTLKVIEQGPIPGPTFEAPDGYQKMDLPFQR